MTGFNCLTPAEAERLAMLAEECAEVIQAVGKILRHGYDSHHPSNPDQGDNRQHLRRELKDVMVVLMIMAIEGDILGIGDDIDDISNGDVQRKLDFTHHQGEFQWPQQSA